jgi:hypothetical protein
MPITSVAQFEAILSRVLSQIDKELIERPSSPPLKEARRTLERANTVARQPAKLKALKAALLQTGEILRSEIPHDNELAEMTWDIIDYLEYQL